MSVTVDTIDHFVERQQLEHVDLIKIDIEGFEGFALDGARQTIATHKPQLLIEFVPRHIERCGDQPERVARLLLSLYKHCYLIDENGKELRQITSIQGILSLTNDNLLLTSTPYPT